MNLYYCGLFWRLFFVRLLTSLRLIQCACRCYTVRLRIVSYLGKQWGVEIYRGKGGCYIDIDKFIKRQASYFLHERECKLRCRFPRTTSPTELVEPNEEECRRGIIGLLYGPMGHQVFSTGVGEWKVGFHIPSDTAHSWCSMNCRGDG